MTTRMMTTTKRLDAVSDGELGKLMVLAQPVEFPAGTRSFEERGNADRFWIVGDGKVRLELRVPGSAAAVTETLGQGSPLGWSWMFPLCRWHMAAKAVTPMRAWEFDAVEVRRLCEQDPRFGYVFTLA